MPAIDFHCSNVLQLFLKKRYEEHPEGGCEYSEEELKTAMWDMDSSVTKKVPAPYSRESPPKDITRSRQIWEEIAPEILVIQKRLLRDHK